MNSKIAFTEPLKEVVNKTFLDCANTYVLNGVIIKNRLYDNSLANSDTVYEALIQENIDTCNDIIIQNGTEVKCYMSSNRIDRLVLSEVHSKFKVQYFMKDGRAVTIKDLDTKISTFYEGASNTETFRKYIRGSEDNLGLPELNIEDMTTRELNDYLAHLDYLWEK